MTRKACDKGGIGRWCAAGLVLLASSDARASVPENPFLQMSLTELLDVEVTSVAGKEQRLAEAAAAVFVISAEDIRRSGATTIPDILRMAPGINVARIDANKWAVTARGQNGLWANKLLVLQDGRSVYTPLFAGVWWDVQSPMLEDIERIEVIRGPGATLWGANAVNGVINIITRSAQDTQGGLLNAGYGGEEPGFASLRYGGMLGEDAHYRVYAKAFRREDAQLVGGGDAWDGGSQGSIGFRTDWARGGDGLSLQGDLYTGENRRLNTLDSLQPPYSSVVADEEDLSGGNLLANWTRQLSDSSDVSLRAWYEYSERTSQLLDERRDTFDVDVQHRWAAAAGHEIIWGLGLRHTRDDIRGSRRVNVEPSSRSDNVISGFLQDEIQLIAERLRLTLGAKIEHNDYTGSEWQPSARLLWTPDHRHSLWAALSRAVRTPSRWDHDGRITGTSEGLTVPNVLSFSGSREMDAESLLAYELGYRVQASEQVSLDIALFYNDYSGLRGISSVSPACQPSATAPPCFIPADEYLSLPFVFDNSLSGESYGFEINADWRWREDLRLIAAYSYLQAHFQSEYANRLDEAWADSAPRNQLSVRAQWDVRPDVDVDLWLRYADDLPNHQVDAYLTLDLRLAWRPQPDLELSLVGRNLLQDAHVEFIERQENLIPTEVERSLYALARWRF